MEKNEATEATQSKTLNPHDARPRNARAMIVQSLREGPQTTIDLHERWLIKAPPRRILKLRLRGYNIASVRVGALAADGIRRSGVARYCLTGEPADATKQQDGGVIASKRATTASGIAGAL